MKTSEVFKQTKQHLAETCEETGTCTRKVKFICTAIAIAAGRSKHVTEADVERCGEIVGSRLEGTYTLEGWLVDKSCIPDYELCDRSTKDRIQAHRHAWLDMLIAEFESKGD
jgi:hypothetical protein